MKKNLLIGLLLVFLMKCSPEKHVEGELWKVKNTSLETFFLRQGTEMLLSGDSVTFSKEGHSDTFHVLMINDRLIIETGASKLLFRMERLSDSAMILHELYTQNPMNVSFTKTTNH
jgi:hypothetical protein